MTTFVHPILGQEAVCPDGLGRVVAFVDEFPIQWIRVQTYVGDRSCNWAPHNVQLVPIAVASAAKSRQEMALYRLRQALAAIDRDAAENVVSFADMPPMAGLVEAARKVLEQF